MNAFVMSSAACFRQSIRRFTQTSIERLRKIPNDELIWKTDENDPRKHTSKHIGLFYLLSNDNAEIVKLFGSATPFYPKATTFHQTIGLAPIMIRKPALETMQYLERQHDSMENVRILLYGDPGRGKTHTLIHVMHYLALKQTHLIINIKDARKFCRSPREICESSTRPGRIDTPFNAAVLLQSFRLQNAALLKQLSDTLVCSQDYTWSSRETTKAGEPIEKIAEHGVERLIHASDCAAVLMKELMLAANEGKVKLATLIDHTNYLYVDEAGRQRHSDFAQVFVDEITVAIAIKKLIKGKQKNSVIIATCEDSMSGQLNQSPQQVLGANGWLAFNPCLPINVPIYSRLEFESCMNFYQDINWLGRPESCTREGRDEIRFMSGLNPGQVFEICKAI